MNDSEIEMLDITEPEIVVEVMIKSDESVVWVNVDGVCRFRVCRIPHLVVYDQRPKQGAKDEQSDTDC